MSLIYDYDYLHEPMSSKQADRQNTFHPKTNHRSFPQHLSWSTRCQLFPLLPQFTSPFEGTQLQKPGEHSSFHLSAVYAGLSLPFYRIPQHG